MHGFAPVMLQTYTVAICDGRRKRCLVQSGGFGVAARLRWCLNRNHRLRQRFSEGRSAIVRLTVGFAGVVEP